MEQNIDYIPIYQIKGVVSSTDKIIVLLTNGRAYSTQYFTIGTFNITGQFTLIPQL
jgi:hypothetical protein